MTLVGYVRSGVEGATLNEQMNALRQAGASPLLIDQSGDADVAYQKLQDMLARMNAGDVLLVWRLDRLGRSVQEVLRLVQQLRQQQIALRTLQDGIDTGAPGGDSQLQVFTALAECSRQLTRDRTKHGLRAANARGNFGGRPREISPELVQAAAEMMRNRDKYRSVDEICQLLGMVNSTLYRYVSPSGEIRIP